MIEKRFKDVVVGLLFVILFGLLLIIEQNVTMKEGIYNEKVINDVRESYERICEEFGFEDNYIEEENYIIAGCKFPSEDGNKRLWSSFVKINK